MVRKTAHRFKSKRHDFVDLAKVLQRVNEHQALKELEQETQLPLRKMLEAILVDARV
jgi:hypothetical protein